MASFRKSITNACDATVVVAAILAPIAWVTLLPMIGALYCIGWLA